MWRCLPNVGHAHLGSAWVNAPRKWAAHAICEVAAGAGDILGLVQGGVVRVDPQLDVDVLTGQRCIVYLQSNIPTIMGSTLLKQEGTPS